MKTALQDEAQSRTELKSGELLLFSFVAVFTKQFNKQMNETCMCYVSVRCELYSAILCGTHIRFADYWWVWVECVCSCVNESDGSVKPVKNNNSCIAKPTLRQCGCICRVISKTTSARCLFSYHISSDQHALVWQASVNSMPNAHWLASTLFVPRKQGDSTYDDTGQDGWWMNPIIWMTWKHSGADGDGGCRAVADCVTHIQIVAN